MWRFVVLVAVLAFVGTEARAQTGNTSIVSMMTANYLTECQRDPVACRTTTNAVLQVLDAAAKLGQGRNYKGCAPIPLSPEQTIQIVSWIQGRPQQVTGYAAEDIGAAAEALWPCR